MTRDELLEASKALQQEQDELLVKYLWDETRVGLDIVEWEDASEHARVQFRNVYQVILQTTALALRKGTDMAIGQPSAL